MGLGKVASFESYYSECSVINGLWICQLWPQPLDGSDRLPRHPIKSNIENAGNTQQVGSHCDRMNRVNVSGQQSTISSDISFPTWDINSVPHGILNQCCFNFEGWFSTSLFLSIWIGFLMRCEADWLWQNPLWTLQADRQQLGAGPPQVMINQLMAACTQFFVTGWMDSPAAAGIFC